MSTIKLPILREGDGIDSTELQDKVKLLQTKLGLLGEAIDGKFGAKTEEAVKRFQHNKGLLEDGIVGQETWSALLEQSVEVFAPYPNTVGSFDIDKIVGSISFPNIRASARKSVPIILKECEISQVTDKGQIAYILATAQHESHLGALMIELASGFAYENRLDLGNTKPGDGPRFKGRGFVQITGRINYTYWSNRLNIDLINNPEKAAELSVAAKILVQGMRDGTFTTYKLARFISGNKRDFLNARKIVNGVDKAAHIAAIAEDLLKVV